MLLIQETSPNLFDRECTAKINWLVLTQVTMAQRVELSERLLKDCKSGKSETVLELISRGANPLYRDWRGWTPLQYASW